MDSSEALTVSSRPASKNITEPCLQFGCCSSLNIEDQFNHLQERSQNCSDESNYDANIDGVHPIAHEHLVHTEVGNKPKSIENQMSATSCSGVLITKRIRAWAMEGAAFAKLYHRRTGRILKNIRKINTRRSCFYRFTP